MSKPVLSRLAFQPLTVLPLMVVLTGALALSACSKKLEAPLPPPLVRLVTVGSVSAAGPAQASPEVGSTEKRLLADLDGRVIELRVQPGQMVRAGQALVRIDPRDARLADSAAQVQLAASKADLNQAEADFQRFKTLREQGFISQAEYDRRATALEVARANFEANADRLGLLSARALVAGRVRSVKVGLNQPVTAGQLLVEIEPHADLVAGRAAASERQTKPGQKSGSAAQAKLIPLTAVLNGQHVFRVLPETKDPNQGTAQVARVAIRIGRSDEALVEVVDGLALGDELVSVGVHLLTDGQLVRLPVTSPR